MSARFFFASNVCDDLINLKKLLIYAVKNKVDFVALTNVITPQCSQTERESYKHALKFINDGFQQQTEFADLHSFIKTFKNDKSGHIIAKSSQQILKIISEAKEKMVPQIKKTLALLKASEVPVIITPGQTENLDIISSIAPEIKEFYLNVDRTTLTGLNILAIGGSQDFDPSVPQTLQDIEYFEGGVDGADFIRDLLNQPTDIFISHAPIKYKTDIGEESKIRPLVNEYLPGNLILTSQNLIKQFETPELLATGAKLIRGGQFSQNTNSTIKGVFWDIQYEHNTLAKALPCKIENDSVYSILPQETTEAPPLIAKREDSIIEGKQKPIGIKINQDVKTALLDISLED